MPSPSKSSGGHDTSGLDTANSLKRKREDGEKDLTKLKFSDHLTYQPITITVNAKSETQGRAQTKKFFVHRSLLERESGYFEKALNGPFKESESQNFELDDMDPDLFGYFVKFIYCVNWDINYDFYFTVYGHNSKAIITSTVSTEKAERGFIVLAKLYAIGERLIAPTFQQHMLAKFTKYFLLYSHTPATICSILDVVAGDLPERTPEVGLRAFVLAYVCKNIIRMRSEAIFQDTLRKHPELGSSILVSKIGEDLQHVKVEERAMLLEG